MWTKCTRTPLSLVYLVLNQFIHGILKSMDTDECTRLGDRMRGRCFSNRLFCILIKYKHDTYILKLWNTFCKWKKKLYAYISCNEYEIEHERLEGKLPECVWPLCQQLHTSLDVRQQKKNLEWLNDAKVVFISNRTAQAKLDSNTIASSTSMVTTPWKYVHPPGIFQVG